MVYISSIRLETTRCELKIVRQQSNLMANLLFKIVVLC
ncbi:hypothetical protein C3B79_2594 [Aeromonas hydrophila]|nr:hypothetical protein C3B79_2594 [Aeromonas hydrophila]